MDEKGKALDCTVNESVVVTVEWGTAEKRAIAEILEGHPEGSSKVVLPELVFPASPAGSAGEEKTREVEDAREGLGWKPMGAYFRAKSGPTDQACLNQEEIIVVCHQGVMEKYGHPLADSTLGIHADKAGSQKDLEKAQVTDPDSRRPVKLTQWDVDVERKRVVKKEARDNGVQFAKTLHTEVAKCTHPGITGDDPLAVLDRKYQMQTLTSATDAGHSESLVERVETLSGRAVVASNEAGMWMLKQPDQITQSKQDPSSGIAFLKKIFSGSNDPEKAAMEADDTSKKVNQSV